MAKTITQANAAKSTPELQSMKREIEGMKPRHGSNLARIYAAITRELDKRSNQKNR